MYNIPCAVFQYVLDTAFSIIKHGMHNATYYYYGSQSINVCVLVLNIWLQSRKYVRYYSIRELVPNSANG